jgi:hypothetical protein
MGSYFFVKINRIFIAGTTFLTGIIHVFFCALF